MTKRTRNRVRSRGKLILNSYTRMVAHFSYIQCSYRWSEWNFRTISLREALNLEAAGEVERITRMKEGVVQVVGYRALKPTSWERPSPTTLTRATLEAVSNRDGKLTRREEMEVIKFLVWPMIGDTKAVRVGPAMTELERIHAERVLKSGNLRAA